MPLGRGEGDIATEAVAEDDGRPAVDDGDQVLHLLVDAERWPDPDGAPVAAAVVDHDPEVVGQGTGGPPHPAGAVHRAVDEHDEGRVDRSLLAHRQPPRPDRGRGHRSLTARCARSSSSALGARAVARCACSPTRTMAWPRSSSSGPMTCCLARAACLTAPMARAESVRSLFAYLHASPVAVPRRGQRRRPPRGGRLPAASTSADAVADVERRPLRRAGRRARGLARRPPAPTPTAGFRIVGAHTDSPNLRVKPHPDTGSVGWRQLAVEVYGGALVNSWLDRDLGPVRPAGRGATARSCSSCSSTEPLARVPQLAIHLDRDVNERGLAPRQAGAPHAGVGAGPAARRATFVELRGRGRRARRRPTSRPGT